MDDWDIELQQDRQVETVERACREIGKVVVADGEKLRAMIEGPERRQLIDWFEEGLQRLQALERIDTRPLAQRLRTALQPRRPPATGTRARPRTAAAGERK